MNGVPEDVPVARRSFWLVPFRHLVADDLERWFEAMAAQGWAPRHLGQWSSVRMSFRRGQARTSRYVVDVQPTAPRADYFSTYQDSGWELVGRMASMIVWRRDYTGDRPEAFSDRESLSGRDRRLAFAAALAAAVFLVGTLAVVLAALRADVDAGTRLQLWLVAALSALLAIGTGSAAITVRRARRGPGA